MKKAKKIVAAMMALVLTFAMGITVSAAPKGTFDVTIKDADKGHTYEAYQVFSGELSEDGKKLSNIKWGEGISEEGQKALGDATEYANKLSGEGVSAEAEAAVIGTYLTSPTASVSESAESDGKYTYVIKDLPAGYYLIKDADNSLNGSESAYTSYILQVVKDVEVEPKADVASVTKFVKDANDSTGETTDWQKSADYDAGDSVPFRLVATMPSNIDDYETYKLVFHDTLSAGLTYTDADAFTVNIGDAVVEGFTKTVTVNDDGTTSVDFACDDIKALGSVTAGTTVAIEYSAVLNENSVIGAQGNPNEVYLEFSNDPNKSGKGENTPTGTTPKDQAVVFTYKVVINKVDQDSKPLAGAEFTLYKMVNGVKTAVTTTTVSEDGTTFEFLRLDDGEYVLEETKTPDGYNSIPEVAFTVVADHGTTLDALTGTQTSEGTTLVRFAENLAEGALATDVMNASGATLPSTGGAGTVAIYTIGIILVLGAAIFLITKKRVNK